MIEISRQTLEKAASGDLDAFEEIYKAASGFVYTLALRVTRDAFSAQEVTQDVFLKVYQSLKNFAFRSSFKTWLFRIAVNMAISSCRKRKRDRKYQQPLDEQKVASSLDSDPAQKAYHLDNEQKLDDALKPLNPDQRACLVMREIQGLSYQEIALSLAIPINTVRSRLKRARLILIKGDDSK